VYPGAFRAFVRPITVSRSEFHLTRYPVKSFTGLGETARSLPRLPPSLKTDALIDSCVYETNETNKDASLRSCTCASLFQSSRSRISLPSLHGVCATFRDSLRTRYPHNSCVISIPYTHEKWRVRTWTRNPFRVSGNMNTKLDFSDTGISRDKTRDATFLLSHA